MSESSTSKPEEASEAPAVERSEKGLRYLFADAEFNEVSGTLLVGGEPVTVEPLPLRLLAELLRRVNEVVTKEELFEAVWAGRVTVDHVLANAVSKLRAALGEQAGARVVNIPRVGYRFDGPVRRVAVGMAQPDLIVGDPVPGREGYVLVRALGEVVGSQVWLAQHAKLGQAHVFKFAEDGPRLAALKREYTLFRVLQAELGPRDDFVRVLDTQFLVAPYFLECEYGGVSLLEWAEHDGRLAGMSVADRLAVFLQMARAVAAAHSVGVLHKDLKPANVLVAGENGAWKVRLTDFGSGRLLDPDQLDRLQLTAMGMTQSGLASADSRSGTLMYLAPELLAGQSATTQSDVYALGVLLYQLLAGDLRRPMTTGWHTDITDALLVEDIAAATQGRPSDRIVSVGDLAERLANLASRREARSREAEQARAASLLAAAEARRRTRRPWVFAAIASLVVGIAASLWLYRQASLSLVQAREQEAKARAISDFLTKDVLQSADVTNLGSKKTLLVNDMLERASRSAQTRFGGLPEIEGQMRLVLGELYYKISSLKEAEAEFRKARELFAAPPQGPSIAQYQAQYDHARALATLSKLDEAKSVLEEADRAVAQSPFVASKPLALAAASARVTVYQGRQQYTEAIKVGDELMTLTDQLTPGDLAARFAARRLLASLLMREDKREEAEVLLREIMSEPYAPSTVGPILYARGQIMMARLLMMQKDRDGALRVQQSARTTLVERLGSDEIDVANVTDEIARSYLERGMFDDARREYVEAHRILRLRAGENFRGTRNAQLNIALVDLAAQRPAQALEAMDDLRPWFVANTGGERSPATQTVDLYRLRAMLDHSDVRRAEALLPTLDPKLLNRAQANDYELMLSAERGRLLILKGKIAEGAALVRPALEVMKTEKMSPHFMARYEAAMARAR